MSRRRGLLAALGILAVLAAAPAAGADEPAGLVAGFVQRAADLAAAGSSLNEAALAPWRRLVAESLDLPGIAAFVVGPAWRSAAAGERTELIGLIGRQIAALYARRVLADRDTTLQITGTQAVGPDEALVSSRLIRHDGTVESIDWLVRRQAAGSLGIFDIVADGQSLAATKRSEYAILLRQGRGDLSSLIEALRRDRQ